MTSYNVSDLMEVETSQMRSQLQFQDYTIHPPAGSSRMNPDYTESTIPLDDPIEDSPKASMWTVGFYQKLFDVNTTDVVNRIMWSMIPQRGVNYLQHYIHSRPDLYGPFWVSVTLIFTIAISGNLANYLQAAASHQYNWKYDFHAVSYSATAVFIYAWILPFLLWIYLRWKGSAVEKVSLLELICVYGYCISIFIPVSVLWVIQVNWLQWILVLIGAILSGSVLSMSLCSLVGDSKLPMAVVVLGLHLLLAVCFMLYFFHVPGRYVPPEVTTTIQLATASTPHSSKNSNHT